MSPIIEGGDIIAPLGDRVLGRVLLPMLLIKTIALLQKLEL